MSCGPGSKGTFSINQIKVVLQELQEIGTIEEVCFEGGEPFLFYPLLLECVKLAHNKGFRTAIETNTYWATTEEDAALWLSPLHHAGLSKLEVSDDTFHHGEEADNTSKRAFSAAQKLGMKVQTICIDEPRIAINKEQVKGKPIYIGGPKLRGRAVAKLTGGLPGISWENFTECPFEDLRHPERVHLDPFGNVHLCQGLSMGNMWKTPLSVLLHDYNPDTHPICGPLLRGGPARLAREHSVEHEHEYIDACHMCTSMCLKLIDAFPQYVGPKQAYGVE